MKKLLSVFSKKLVRAFYLGYIIIYENFQSSIKTKGKYI